MWTEKFMRSFSKLYSFVNKFVSLQKPFKRNSSHEKILKYEPGSPEFDSLQEAMKNISSNLTFIPICVGEKTLGAKDLQFQYMPHNTRQKVSQYARANSAALDLLKCVIAEVREEWSATPMAERIEICNKCADIIANEDRHALNAAIMLGQSKTYRQAEEDTCRTINSLRNFAELLSKKQKSCESGGEPSSAATSNGCVAALTPYNWTSQAVNLALCPALMGHCVVWVPSAQNMLSSYYMYRSFEKAGIPKGVINFIPMKLPLFLHEAQNMPEMMGLNYAGRVREYEQELANAVSSFLGRPFTFLGRDVPVENKNFHFVHESANVESVAEETVRAAFDYNGQRGNSCENLYVPKSLWPQLQDALICEMDKLVVGDVCDTETTNSAVIDRNAYDRLVNLLQHAEQNEHCSILCGGNYSRVHGNFIEPTVVVCETLNDRLMTRETEGPILSVAVYENCEMDAVVEHINCNAAVTLTGSVFAANDDEACKYATPLRTAAANLYLNKACIGNTEGRVNEVPDLNEEFIAGKNSLLKHW